MELTALNEIWKKGGKKLLLYVYEKQQIISCEFGDSNLDEDDYEEGYDCYLNYYQFDADDIVTDYISEMDGGMYMFNSTQKPYRDNLELLIRDLLSYIYEQEGLGAGVLVIN